MGKSVLEREILMENCTRGKGTGTEKSGREKGKSSENTRPQWNIPLCGMVQERKNPVGRRANRRKTQDLSGIFRSVEWCRNGKFRFVEGYIIGKRRYQWNISF